MLLSCLTLFGGWELNAEQNPEVLNAIKKQLHSVTGSGRHLWPWTLAWRSAGAVHPGLGEEEAFLVEIPPEGLRLPQLLATIFHTSRPSRRLGLTMAGGEGNHLLQPIKNITEGEKTVTTEDLHQPLPLLKLASLSSLVRCNQLQRTHRTGSEVLLIGGQRWVGPHKSVNFSSFKKGFNHISNPKI